MNILHLTPYYAPGYAFGGVARAVEGMARALVEAGHRVTVLTTDALAPGARIAHAADELRDGVRIIRVANLIPRGTLNLSTPFALRRRAREWAAWADVIHCHEFRTVENGLVAPLAQLYNKPLILSPHGTLTYAAGRSLVKSGWDALLSPALARRFDLVIGLTQAEADEARAFWMRFGALRTEFAVVPNGIDLREFADLRGGDTFRAQYGLGDAPVVLFLGRLHPRKGAHLLAEAFQAADVPEARLIIAGPDEGGRALLQPWLNERVILTGYLDPAARLAALAAADVFALPAIGEGLSLAALEALAAGVPVVISPECHLPEIAQAGAGIECARAAEPLAAVLRRLLTDPAARERMGAAARQLAHESFDWQVVAAHLLSIYERFR